MKIITALILLMLVCSFAVVQAGEDRKLRVNVTMRDGSTGDYKLDWIDEKKVVVFEHGTLKAVTLNRDNVLSLSFSGDFGNKFRAGDEGFVLSNGSVLRGHPTSMDADTFWIVPEGSRKEEKIDRTKVAFIQFVKPSESSNAGPGTNTGAQKPLSVTVTQLASKPWTDTGVNVIEGQKLWFTVSEQETYGCGPMAPKVNADGQDPLMLDKQRPIPDVKHCALIARIGVGGSPFRIGLNRTPFTANTSGRLFIGLNDDDFSDNVGKLTVYIKTGD